MDRWQPGSTPISNLARSATISQQRKIEAAEFSTISFSMMPVCGISLGAHLAQPNPPIASIRERQTVNDDLCHSARQIVETAEKRGQGMLATVLRYNSPRARIYVYT